MVLERTVTTENGRTILRERRYSGLLDADGTFHLRTCCGKRFTVRQGFEERIRKRNAAA